MLTCVPLLENFISHLENLEHSLNVSREQAKTVYPVPTSSTIKLADLKFPAYRPTRSPTNLQCDSDSDNLREQNRVQRDTIERLTKLLLDKPCTSSESSHKTPSGAHDDGLERFEEMETRRNRPPPTQPIPLQNSDEPFRVNRNSTTRFVSPTRPSPLQNDEELFQTDWDSRSTKFNYESDKPRQRFSKAVKGHLVPPVNFPVSILQTYETHFPVD